MLFDNYLPAIEATAVEGDCSAGRLRQTVRFGLADLLTRSVISVDAGRMDTASL